MIARAPSLEVDRLSKRFSGRRAAALNEVTLSIPPRAITSLLGPSGSGKTTLLRLLAGLEVADAGRILVDGEDWSRVPVRQRGVGLVFQSYALFEHMTVSENVAFGLRAQRWPRSDVEARVRELLALVQLNETAGLLPRQLSGGQQQRVAFARALAPKPWLLLLDEPFGALDAHVRVELRRWLAELHQRTGVTTLLVTHDQEEALEISQHIVVLQEGRVVQSGTPEEIYDQPASPFVASFVGAANRLRGRVEAGRAKLGPLSVAVTASPDGAAVEAYVRPHDVRLGPPPVDAPAASLGTVTRSTRVGGTVKIDLCLASLERMVVDVALAEAEALGLRVGDSVFLDVRAAKLFVENG